MISFSSERASQSPFSGNKNHRKGSVQIFNILPGYKRHCLDPLHSILQTATSGMAVFAPGPLSRPRLMNPEGLDQLEAVSNCE